MFYFDPIQILRQNNLTPPPHARFHLAVFAEPFLSAIYSGKKTMESRITINRIAPWDRIRKDDLVFIKRSSGPIEAVFTAGEIVQLDLTRTPIDEIWMQYGDALCADEAFRASKTHCRYAVLMEITKLQRINPVCIKKKGMQTWLILQ